MDKLAALWALTPLWIGLFVLIVIAVVIARRHWFRATQAAARDAAPTPPSEADSDAVDSSHIGFAPLVGGALQQPPVDADGPARGEQARDDR